MQKFNSYHNLNENSKNLLLMWKIYHAELCNVRKMDDYIEESCCLRKGDITIEAFDYVGSLWPLYPGRQYLVDLGLQQLEFSEPVIINDKHARIEQINETFAHYLYGYVKNNILYVGGFQFDFSKFNDYDQYEDKYLKFKADRINVEFLEELPLFRH